MTCARCGRLAASRLVRVRPALVVALYAAAFALAYGLGGALLHDVVEGLDRTQLTLWKLWLPLGALVAALAAHFVRLRRPVCEACGAAGVLTAAGAAPRGGTTRRAFLRTLGATGALVAGFGAAVARNRGWLRVARDIAPRPADTTVRTPRPEWQGARIVGYRRLGRTGATVSDISLGSSRIKDVEIAKRAIDRGVTYFDTAPDYAETGSERLLGEAMKGRRQQMFVATKFCVADGHLPTDTPVPRIIEAVEGSLRRLETDWVDLIHIHACDRVDRLMAANFHEAFDRLKEQGKARFLGVSTHTPNLEAVANAAIDSGRFDVLMLAYHFGMWPHFSQVLARAKERDVGVVAMKTLKGAKQENLSAFRDQTSSYAQAAFRWVLSNPDVSCLVVSFFDPRHVDEYLAVSGQAPRPGDTALLRRYDELIAGDYCQPHCGVCLDSCPYELPIDDVLRYRMYARDYGWAAEGVRQYARLERDASICITCPAPCAGRCPLGVPIRDKMIDAHVRLG